MLDRVSGLSNKPKESRVIIERHLRITLNSDLKYGANVRDDQIRDI